MKELVWKAVKAVRLEDLSEEQKARIAGRIVNDFRDWKHLRKGVEDVWHEIDRAVNQYDPNYTPVLKAETNTVTQVPGHLGSKLRLANAYAHREGIVATMMNNLMANDYDFFDLDPLDVLDEEMTEAVKQYLIWLFGEINFEGDFAPFVRDAVSYGFAVASYEWNRETGPRWKRDYVTDPMSGKEIQVDYETQETIYNAPKFTPLNVYDVVLDPTSRNIKTATLIMIKPVSPYEYMANPAYAKKPFEFIQNAPAFGGNEFINAEIEKKLTEGDSTYSPATAYQGKKLVYEAWGDIVDEDVIFKNYVAEVVSGELVRFEPNPYYMPYKPFVISRYTPETNRLYSHTPMASITSLQAAYDTIVNQFIDWWTMEINRPILMKANNIVRSSRDSKQALPPISKDAVWYVRETDGVKRLDWGNRATAPNPEAILGLLDTHMQKATGDNDLNSGGTDNQYLTTGNAVMRNDAGSAKFRMYAKVIEQDAIVPVLEITIDLLRQMGGQEERTFNTTNIPGKSTVLFKPTYLLNSIKFVIRGASFNAAKQVNVNNLQQFLTSLASNPLTAQLINWVKAIKIVGSGMGLRNAQELLTPQANQLLMSTPPNQLPFFQRVAQLLAGQQGSTPGAPQIPGQSAPGGTPATPEVSNGPQQFTNNLAPAVGGNAPGSGTTSPFDGSSVGGGLR